MVCCISLWRFRICSIFASAGEEGFGLGRFGVGSDSANVSRFSTAETDDSFGTRFVVGLV